MFTISCRTTKPKDGSQSAYPKVPKADSDNNSSPQNSVQTKVLPPLVFKDLLLDRTSNNTPPISAAELTAATDAYIELLKSTRYFDVLNERIHGWPESDTSKPPFGIWWIGVQLERRAGQVVYRHHEIGSDNAATDTGAMLENLCYAHRFFGPGKHSETLKRTALGLAGLSKAMRQSSQPYNDILLARSFYPESVESKDQSVPILFDYSRARPGIDNSATEYVQITDNPFWGDIYIKNKRSKDDMGHVMRSLAQTAMTCEGILDDESKIAFNDAKSTHMLWAQRVLIDEGAIATIDKKRKLYWPFETLARFVNFAGIECNAFLSMQMFSSGTGRDYDCGDGTNGIVDWLAQLNDQNLPLIESYHLAAMASSLSFNQITTAKELGLGVASRINKMSEVAYANSWTESYPSEHFSALLARGNALGIPLQNNEARWLQKQIIKAKNSYLEPSKDHLYDFLNKREPDGIYPYTPNGEGFFWRDIGSIIGTCSSMWLAQGGAKIIDCERVRREFNPG